MRLDYEKYIGMYQGQYDMCWSLVELIMKEVGYLLPQHLTDSQMKWQVVGQEAAKKQAALEPNWIQVDKPYQELDVLLFEFGPRLHTTVALDRYSMIHAIDVLGVATTRWTQHMKKIFVSGYRYDA